MQRLTDSTTYTLRLVPTDDNESPMFQRWDAQGPDSLYYDPRTGLVGTFDEHGVSFTYSGLIPVTYLEHE